MDLQRFLFVRYHVGIHMADWHPTAYRTHTLSEIQQNGAELVGQEVTVAGFM